MNPALVWFSVILFAVDVNSLYPPEGDVMDLKYIRPPRGGGRLMVSVPLRLRTRSRNTVSADGWMEKEVLECVLKRCWKDGSVSKILSIESSPAVGKFQNFLSNVTRLKVKVVLGNGRVTTRYFILKTDNVDPGIGKFMQQKYDVFRVETMIYESVLKEMKYLMDEFEDSEGVLWCDLVNYVPYTSILLQDLKPMGYCMVDRSVMFDLEHSLLAVSCLGRYHGLSKALQERGTLANKGYKPWHACNDIETHQFWASTLTAMVQGVKMHWDPRWGPIVDKIKISAEQFTEKLVKLCELDETKFNVVGHGDINKNNIMFKYDWQNRPILLRFLDFQVPYYGSPCCDLTYITYLSVEPSVRRANLDQLLEAYHGSLTRTLDRYQFGGDKPTLQEIKDGVENFSFLGIWMFLTYYPAAVTSANMDTYFDLDKLAATQGKEGHNLDLYKLESLEKNVGPDLEDFVEKFF